MHQNGPGEASTKASGCTRVGITVVVGVIVLGAFVVLVTLYGERPLFMEIPFLRGIPLWGTALIMVPNMANPITATRCLYLDITHEVSYTEESLKQILLLAGFSSVTIYPVEQYCLPNPILNFLGKMASQFMFAGLRVIYLLNAVRSTRIYTKSLLAVATK